MNFDQQNVIKMLGIENLPDERKIEILNQMTALLEKRLMVRMLKELHEAEQEQFAEVMEKNDAVAVQQFISTHFPDFPVWINDEVMRLKQELSNHVKTLS